MSNLPTDKYTIFMVDTDMMTPEQYKDLANANSTVLEVNFSDMANYPFIEFPTFDKAFEKHEQFLEEVKEQNKEIDKRMELGEEGV